MRHVFYAYCDVFRSKPHGESQWQEMMANKVPISLPSFLLACDTTGLLDEGETFSDWWAIATVTDRSTGVYRSFWRRDDGSPEVVYFIQTSGFEAIFRLMS